MAQQRDVRLRAVCVFSFEKVSPEILHYLMHFSLQIVLSA